MAWIGVDLDGTLAQYTDFAGATVVGEPIPAMVTRVKAWLAAGVEVRIFTARAALVDNPWADEMPAAIEAIEQWCEQHIGQRLDVTATKDFEMAALWDDRAVAVETNTGRALGGALAAIGAPVTLAIEAARRPDAE